jgi:ATP-dependent RNA helicase DDX49/DBP8
MDRDVSTRVHRTAELLRLMFKELDIRSTCLHSNMSQRERLASIAKFRSNIVPILITTDVGSRGLDIPTVQLVINYDVPADCRDYIHRIGRTARAGRGGLALTMMSEMDIELMLAIEKKIGKKLVDFNTISTEAGTNVSSKELVKEKDVLALLTEVGSAKRIASMALSEALAQSKKSLNKLKMARVMLLK